MRTLQDAYDLAGGGAVARGGAPGEHGPVPLKDGWRGFELPRGEGKTGTGELGGEGVSWRARAESPARAFLSQSAGNLRNNRNR